MHDSIQKQISTVGSAPVVVMHVAQDLQYAAQLIRQHGGRATPRLLMRWNCRRYPTAAVAESVLARLVAAGLAHWVETPHRGRPVKTVELTEVHDTNPNDESGNAASSTCSMTPSARRTADPQLTRAAEEPVMQSQSRLDDIGTREDAVSGEADLAPLEVTHHERPTAHDSNHDGDLERRIAVADRLSKLGNESLLELLMSNDEMVRACARAEWGRR